MAETASVLKNAAKGKAFAKDAIKGLEKTQAGIQEEVTVVTKSGARMRLDAIGRNGATGKVKISEIKSSAKAPLTKGQKAAHHELSTSGATVVGKGKPGFEGGTKIPPTAVDIIRP